MKLSRKVLCIDHKPTHLSILRQVLSEADFETTLVSSAEAGLSQCANCRYDAVLTDHEMPLLNCLELLVSLKQFDNAPPVIILTSHGSEEIAVQAMKLGAMDYIVEDDKQEYLKQLGVTLHQAIELHEARLAREKQIAEQAKLLNELQTALENVKRFSGLIPICSSCKGIKDNSGRWHQLEAYFQAHFHINFTHSICPDCAQKLYPLRKSRTDS